MRKEELFTFSYIESGYKIAIHSLTWQQALIEKSRLFWKYSDTLPIETRTTEQVYQMFKENHVEISQER